MARSTAGSWLLPSGLAAGSLVALLFEAVPPSWLLVAAALAASLVFLITRFRWIAGALLACCWSLWNFQSRLDDRLPAELSGEVLAVTGVVSSIPRDHGDYLSFRFEPLHDPGSAESTAGLPDVVLVRWYEQWPAVSAGQRWLLQLLVKPPWGPVNFQGADKEKWLFASGVGAVGTVREGQLLGSAVLGLKHLTVLRESVYREISKGLPDARTAGVIQALAVGDRSGIMPTDRQLLIVTGTSHLLAISGLHIGLAASGGLLLARGLGWFLPFLATGRAYFLFGLMGAALAALAYAGLAGFGIPTIRSLLMLLVAMTAVSASRHVNSLRAWLLALAAILLIDPFAPLGAGFWFSFLAVLALLLTFLPRSGGMVWWRSLLLAQVAVTLVLLPVGAVWFQTVSLASYFANLVAIPTVSLLIVPLVLAGILACVFSASLAVLLWTLAGQLITPLLAILERIAALQGGLTELNTPGPLAVFLALVGSALLLLPRGFPGRWHGLLLLAGLFLPAGPRPNPGGMELEVLDVGQGTAAVLRTADYTLLYDSGPGDGAGRDMVSGVIAPAAGRAARRAPDRIIISHGDQDHAGGLWSLLARYPEVPVFANLARPRPTAAECRAPMTWSWRDTTFEVLHPSAGLPYLGNDSSCVLEIKRPGGRILLSGDISSAVEARLLKSGLAPSDVLLVPHHGSRTSSSSSFLAAVKPRLAVATASLGNRFGFPKTEVRHQYLRVGSRFWTTGGCGALRIYLGDDGRLTATSARLDRPAIWRWPAADGCPRKQSL